MRDTPTMDLAAMRRRAEAPGHPRSIIHIRTGEVLALLNLVERLAGALEQLVHFTEEFASEAGDYSAIKLACAEARAALRAVGKGE